MGLLKELDQKDPAKIGQELHRFAEGLYPICRSITGDGIRRTLTAIQDRIPLQISNVLLVCPKCGKATRTGARYKDDGSKVRFCKKCTASCRVRSR